MPKAGATAQVNLRRLGGERNLDRLKDPKGERDALVAELQSASEELKSVSQTGSR